MAADCVRYGINALQSLHAIRSSTCFPKLGAWQIIQAYYAAFFAAHSILRLFGQPFSNLELGHSRQICDRAKIEMGYDNVRLQKGNYLGKYDSNFHTVQFSYKRDSHKDLWATYVNFLDEISMEVLTVSGLRQDIADISNELTAIAELLRKSGAVPQGNWLSLVRNEVNYKAPADSWFPFSKNPTTSRSFFDSLNTMRNGSFHAVDCVGQKTELERFLATCLLVVQLTNKLLEDYVLVSADKCRFATLFQKFTNQAKGTFEV